MADIEKIIGLLYNKHIPTVEVYKGRSTKDKAGI